MAIILKEAGLLDRTQIYATDLDEAVLEQASRGVYPIDRVQEYTANYHEAGGAESFADYYMARYDSVIMDAILRDRVVFSTHNLVTDGAFGEMDVIFCRNVLIYFDRELQDRVVRLFLDSLSERGFLCLGSKESIRFATCAHEFERFHSEEKIYRKKPLTTPGGDSDAPAA